MSGICGIVNLNGSPVDPELLNVMTTAMAFWANAGTKVCVSGPAGFGKLLFLDTPEDRFDEQPRQVGGQFFVASARLDNRDELLLELEVSQDLRDSTPDSELLRKAWERWGEKCTSRLYGDWSFAAWDGETQSLFVARDQLGITALYWVRVGKTFAFASSIKALLALPFVSKEVDELRMAQVLIAWMGSGDRTAYKSIKLLCLGHQIRVNSSSEALTRHWQADGISPRTWPSDSAFFEEFSHRYSQAVKCRLRGDKPVAATLSGGFDSGSVVALAGPMLAEEGRPLTAFTSVPYFDPSASAGSRRTGDEWEQAHATAVMAQVGEHVRVDSSNVSIAQAIRQMVEAHDTPAHAATNYYWLNQITRESCEQGHGTLLIGQHGNASVSYSGTGSLLPILKRGDLSGFRKSLCLTEPSVLLGIKRQIVKPLLLWPPAHFRSTFMPSRKKRFMESAISLQFARDIDLERLLAEALDDFASHPRIGPAPRSLFYRAGMSVAHALWREMAASKGLSIRDPTADRRLVELCFSAPDHYFRRRGVHRWLLRQVMKDRMPASVLQYKHKGLQASDIGYRIKAGQQDLHAALDQFASHPLSNRCLDIDRMRKLLHSLDQEVNTRNVTHAGLTICVGSSVGYFLGRF